MTRSLMTLAALCVGVTPSAAAQGTDEVRLSSCVATGNVKLVLGRKLVVTCDSVFVYNAVGKRAMMLQAESLLAATAVVNRRYDSLVTNLKGLAALAESISSSKSEVIAQLHAIRRIDSIAYDSLRHMTDSAMTLTHRSTENTDKALRYINRVQFASYVASAFGGAVVGGFASKGSGESGFNLTGAAIGAGTGILVNYLVMRLLAR